MSGDSASSSISAAMDTSAGSGADFHPFTGEYGSASSSNSPEALGTDRTTGPGRPLRSIVNARRMNSGTRSGLSMYPYHLETDFRLAVTSNCEFSLLPAGTPSVMQRMGEPSS